ncbi:MAG TPA: ABC transporter ATP-binding protein [Gaiellales bacterium]|nr:ABC transporter ATP-binding protein [Gaiellales bacterium]
MQSEAAVRRRGGGILRLAPYLAGRRRAIVVMLVVATAGAAAQTGGWILVRLAIDNGIGHADVRYLEVVVAFYLLLGAAGWVLSAILIRGLATIGQAAVVELRRDLFDHLTSLSLRYFSEQRAGWIIARLTSDVDALSELLSEDLPTLVSNVVLLPTAVVGLFVVDWRLGLAAIVTLPASLALTRWFQRRSSVAQLEVRNTISAVTAHLAESVAGMAVVQAFTRERAFQREFDRLNAANRSSNVAAQRLFSVFFPSIELLGVVSTVSVLLVGTELLANGSLTIGALITETYLLQLVFQPLQELSDVYGDLQSGAAAMVKIGMVLDTTPDIPDTVDAPPMPRIEGRLDLDGVTFAYGRTQVLHGIDVHVPAGGCIALVGRSGGGKSTLAKLIARFYDPVGGSVRVDGIDLRGVRLRSYRRQLGVVLQDPFLFAGTIADNIRFARPDATDREVAAAAEDVGVSPIAARFPDGLGHRVREGGAGLSAGERQLISIARALLADPRVLILDEATSSIDRPTERRVEEALDRLLHGRTSVVIAHRLATVRRADEIFVIERGRVVERGSAAELLGRDGAFRRLARSGASLM